ncbi:Gfo/Idh/MocA family protein [Enterococcus xiangfangensis]|uniref:Gfo/Idh/MocA family protein n=1 Tax=Enterococcus xiangfangensis TaxID=1296537 RepID=UPI0010F941B5|nr:Gfo/Idh/MocA family oxidoreductase [Enterococcus xiangfangensis]MBM7711120.1 putative dehydrogenase [Enterococcus xiangfangensis]NBK07708.1 gfo/Idh/MocA family oxidoreductase [Enterococcus asini]
MKKVAIVGAGQVAEKVHAAYYRTKPEEFILAAVVDPDLARGVLFCQNNQFKNAYTTIEEMLTKENPDIVSICTPNRFHYDSVMSVLEAGCSVFCEKPPAMTSIEAKNMWKLAEEKEAILAYDFQHRYSPEAKMLKENIALLGDIYYSEANALRRSGVPGWGNFIDKELQGGGPLIDYGIHMLDTALYLLDFPTINAVSAYQYQKIGPKKNQGTFGTWDPAKYTVEDSLFGTIEFKNGGILRINTSFALNIQPEKELDIQLCGDQAGANLYPGKIYTDQAGELKIIKQIDVAENNNHFTSIDNFYRKVIGDPQAVTADGRQGYIIQRVIEALYQSAETGGKVEL